MSQGPRSIRERVLLSKANGNPETQKSRSYRKLNLIVAHSLGNTIGLSNLLVIEYCVPFSIPVHPFPKDPNRVNSFRLMGMVEGPMPPPTTDIPHQGGGHGKFKGVKGGVARNWFNSGGGVVDNFACLRGFSPPPPWS